MLNFSKGFKLKSYKKFTPKLVFGYEQLCILNSFLVGFLQIDRQIPRFQLQIGGRGMTYATVLWCSLAIWMMMGWWVVVGRF